MYELFSKTRETSKGRMAVVISTWLLLFSFITLNISPMSVAAEEGESTPQSETIDPPPAPETTEPLPPPPEPTPTPPPPSSDEPPPETSGNSPTGTETPHHDPTGESAPPTDSGQDGTSGNGAEDVASSTPPGDTTIETGDAVALLNADNIQNTSLIGENASTSSDVSGSHGSTTEDGTPHWAPPLHLTVQNQNNATTSNAADVGAATGNNSAVGSGTATITTGDAYAAANVINILNVNITDSSGFLLLLNNLFGQSGTFDLRPFLLSPALPASCDGGCDPLHTLTTLTNENTATITNDVIVRSSTGGNSIDSATGDGLITTGDAYAAANVLNVANTNILNSNYMLLMLNSLGDWDGDLVLPTADFFSSFLGNGGGLFGGSVANTNSAAVTNALEIGASSGNNEITGTTTTTGIVNTGNANASANVLNQLNTNIIGGNAFYLVFRFLGDWMGDVFNAPEGLSWRESELGLELWSGGVGSGGNAGGFSGTVTNTNTATVNNNVQVLALTGENKIAGAAGTAALQTGNAYAAANVLTIGNSNVIGSNWALAVINVLGNWRGNISFGQPDLWIGALASSGDNFSPGSNVEYTMTIKNRGDAPASNVVIQNRIDRTGILNFDNINTNGQPSDIAVGALRAGETRTVRFAARVADGIPTGDSIVNNSLTVKARETDANPADNTETISILARRMERSGAQNAGGGASVSYTPDPKLYLTKINSAPFGTNASSSVNYTLTIKNDGGSAYHSVLIDTLKNEHGRVVNRQEWELGEIVPGEEITVFYTTLFSASTTPGIYTNYAEVKSISRHPSLNPFYGWFANSNVATSSVMITAASSKNIGGIGGNTDHSANVATSSTITSNTPLVLSFISPLFTPIPRIPHVPSSPTSNAAGVGGDLGVCWGDELPPPGGTAGRGLSLLDEKHQSASIFTALQWPWGRRFSVMLLTLVCLGLFASRIRERSWRTGFTEFL